MARRKQWWAGLCIAGLFLWPAGCGNLLKFKSDNDQKPVSDLQKGQIEDLREADSPSIQPETHLAAGRLHETQGRLVRAAEQYRLAVAAKPSSVDAWNRLGIVLDRLGRFKEADEAFTEAIRLAPDQAYLHNNIAFSYILQARWREAEVALTKAIEIDPAMARARVNLAITVAQQGRFPDAFHQFQSVLPLEDAHYNMGLMYQSKRMNVEAAKSFKAALRANPKLLAAQKRLDSLPKDTVTQAEVNTEASASPLPHSNQLAADGVTLHPTPTTRPAIADLSRERPAVKDISHERRAAEPVVVEVVRPERTAKGDAKPAWLERFSEQMARVFRPKSSDVEEAEAWPEAAAIGSASEAESHAEADEVDVDDSMPRDD
ncbi:MAG: tetratricopeptide repeat protein [Phycisphaerae bacterium]|nr:tetratricopeptide repeat protein [Phycisphaerae bacterium]